jgi:flagellar biogenesis protein FliO
MGNQGKKIGLGSPTRRVALGVPFLCLLLLVVSGGWIGFPNATRRVGGTLALASRGSEAGGVRREAPGASGLAWSDPNLPSSPGLHLGHGELFLRMMLSVGLVLALGAAALVLSRKVLPGVAQRGGKEIHVLETVYLGPRKALHLVEVGHQRLLIASTNDSVTMLAPVNEAWLEAAQPELDEAAKA